VQCISNHTDGVDEDRRNPVRSEPTRILSSIDSSQKIRWGVCSRHDSGIPEMRTANLDTFPDVHTPSSPRLGNSTVSKYHGLGEGVRSWV